MLTVHPDLANRGGKELKKGEDIVKYIKTQTIKWWRCLNRM
jgi:hypothetical protein